MEQLKQIGLAIIMWLGINLLFSTTFLLLGIALNKNILFLSLLVVIVIMLFYEKIRTESFLKALIPIGLFLGSVTVAIVVATVTKDFSWDGQSYHQEAIIQLRNGWNPMYNNDLYEYLGTKMSDGFLAPFWISHYPQGLWYLQTLFFDLTNSIETGKAINMLLMTSLFYITMPITINKMKNKYLAILVSLIVVFNPVVISQVFTFYNDATVYLLFTLLVVLSLYWFLERDWYIYLPSLVSVIIIVINIKFTALGYTMIAILLPLTLIVMNAFKEKSIKSMFIKKYNITYIVVLGSLFFGILVVGKTSYVNNFTENGHPFYPLVGENKVDIMSYNYVNGIQEAGRIEGLYISQISEVNNDKNGPIVSKFPLSISNNELIQLVNPDTRIGGFGPLFGAVLLVSIIGLILVTTKKFVRNQSILFVISLIVLISVLINPETWWARYVPQFWLLPVLFIIMMDRFTGKKVKIISILTLCLILVNSVVTLENQIRWQYQTQNYLNQQMDILRKENVAVEFASFKSNRQRFKEYGVSFKVASAKEYKYSAKLVKSTTQILTNDKNLYDEITLLNERSRMFRKK